MVIHYYPARARAFQQPAAVADATPQCTPQWRWMYALLPLLLGLLLVERRQPLTRMGHIVAQCAIVLLVYGLLALWLQTNRAAMGVHQPAAKPKLVYGAYTPAMDELAHKPASSLQAVMPQQMDQGLALSGLPQHDRVSLQDRRN